MSKRSQEILELYKSAVMPTYTPSVVVSSGKGVTVRDVDGRTYYVFTSGNVRVLRHVTCNDRPNGKFPSDHDAVLVRLQIQ